MKLHRRAARHAVNGGLKLLAVTLALLALAVPAYAYWESTRPPGVELAPQVEVPLPESPVTLGEPMPDYEGVIALCYHDISPTASDAYVVTPRSFAAQMAALKAAGFETISLDEFNAYMHGEPVDLPAKPLLLTFDDGTKSNWVYADPIIEEVGFEASNFLSTANVSHHQPYYLLWEEVEAMQESGRWSFGSHTDDGHGFVDTDGHGHEGPFLTNRQWLPRLRRLETRGEYEARIEADIDRSIARLQAHGLPRPTAFAYPFSAVEASNDPLAARLLRRLLSDRFADQLVNRSEDTLIGPGMSSPLSRIEVFQGTTTRALLKQARHTIEHGETGRHLADG